MKYTVKGHATDLNTMDFIGKHNTLKAAMESLSGLANGYIIDGDGNGVMGRVTPNMVSNGHPDCTFHGMMRSTGINKPVYVVTGDRAYMLNGDPLR